HGSRTPIDQMEVYLVGRSGATFLRDGVRQIADFDVLKSLLQFLEMFQQLIMPRALEFSIGNHPCIRGEESFYLGTGNLFARIDQPFAPVEYGPHHLQIVVSHLGVHSLAAYVGALRGRCEPSACAM